MFCPVRCHLDVVTVRLKQAGHYCAGIRVIVHKQDDVSHLHPLAVPVRRL